MSARTFELRQLKYFIALAEELNFRRAANRLHISQPPLTRQIQQMESDLGVELFTRTPRGVELTQAGKVLLEEATNIMALSERATERAQLAGQGQLGRMDIGIFGSATFDTIPKLILGFRSAHPNVNIVLHNMTKSEQINALRERRLTVGFNRFVAAEPDIATEIVYTENALVAIHRAHAFARKQEVNFKELKDQPLILYPRATRNSFADMVTTACREAGFEPRIVQEVDDVSTSIALVSSGFGVCVVPESARNLKLPGVVYRPLRKAKLLSIDLCCLYRKDDQSPILLEFLDIVRKFGSVRAPR